MWKDPEEHSEFLDKDENHTKIQSESGYSLHIVLWENLNSSNFMKGKKKTMKCSVCDQKQPSFRFLSFLTEPLENRTWFLDA